MKRTVSILLIAALLLTLMPLAALAADTPISVSWSGSGDWVNANVQPDNSRSYTIEFDVNLPAIASASANDTWADNAQFYIRNAVLDDYIYFRIQSYRNGSGQYQIATSTQVWNGSAWSDRDFIWSSNYAQPITEVHMKLMFDAPSSTFAWVATDKNGVNLGTDSVNPAWLTPEILSCTSCEFKMLRSSTDILPTNTTLTYGEGKAPEDEPPEEEDVTLVTSSEKWALDTGFAVNEEDTRLYLTDKNCGLSLYNERVNIADGFELTTDWHIEGKIDNNNNYGGRLYLYLRDEATDSYVFFRLCRYRSGGGTYQVWLSAQYWCPTTHSWSNNVIGAWATKPNNAILNDVGIAISRNPNEQALSVTLTDKDTDSVMLQAKMAPAGFDDSAMASEFVSRILTEPDAEFRVGADSATENLFYLTNPEIAEFENVVTQNDFSLEGVWQAGVDENGYCYSMTSAGAGWLTYNAPIDVSAGFSFSYDLSAEEFQNNAVASLLRLRCSQNPEIYFFARLFLTGGGEHRIQGQRYDSSANPNWKDLMVQNNWVAGDVTDDTVRVCVDIQNQKLTITFKNKAGNVLGTYETTDLPAEFFSCETMELKLGSEANNGRHILSNFKGLPEISSPDKRAIPFTKAVFAGDLADAWADELCNAILEYQNSSVSTAACAADAKEILAANGDLIILAEGKDALLGGTSAADFAEALSASVAEVKAESKNGTVLVLCGLPYLSDKALGAISLETYAAYNAAIRTVAEENGALYADLYAADSSTPWSVKEDGVSASSVGGSLIAGAILKELLRSCSCLAVNATAPLKISATSPLSKTETALAAFAAAANAEELKVACEDGHLGLNLNLYRAMTSAQQADVIAALLAKDRSGADTYEKADAIFGAACMAISRAIEKDNTPVSFETYVAVGDSISVGETSVNKARDGWVPHFAQLISAAQGSNVTLINKAISGTRMCTITDNGVYPPAKDTVQEYIVPNDPDLLTIAYGINDFHAGTTLEEFITTYRGYLAEVTESCPDAFIIVCGLCAKGGDADSTKLQLWNKEIKALAEEFSLVYCETYFDMRGVEWLLTDGLHPTNAGYRVMANALFRTLNAEVNLSGEGVPVLTPGDYGWNTDNEDFSGWTAPKAETFCADYNETANNHRIWKPVLTDQNNFTVDADITVDSETSAYIKVLGVIIELDGRHGSGNQAYPKVDGQNGGCDWLAADGGKIHVSIVREDGGDLVITLTGSGTGESFTYTVSAKEENENVELGLYSGSAAYKNIVVVSGEAPCEHEWQINEAACVAATCEDGGTDAYVCTLCGETKTEPTSALGHDYDHEITDPTCTENGFTTFTCTRCGDSYQAEEVDALGHDYEQTVVLPTCTEAGFTQYTCTRCGDIYQADEVDALGHDYVDGICARCGAEDPNYEPPVPVDPCEGYTDIDRSKWYHAAADFVIENGLMGSTKTEELTFEPNTKVSRAMVASILYRIAGNGEVLTYQGTFTDVKAGKWYTVAIEWCAKNGLASGKGNGTFDPNGNVTRQELAVFFYNLAKFRGADVSGKADLASFSDGASVPSWARSYVAWAVDAGLISGKASGGTVKLAPLDTATRAELASILMRFLQK